MENRGAFLEPARANSRASATVNGKHVTPDFKNLLASRPGWLASVAARSRSDFPYMHHIRALNTCS